MTQALKKLSTAEKEAFEKEGYVIIRGLFSEEDVKRIHDLFEEISHQTIPGHFEPDFSAEQNDPLKRYPRVMHPHRFNEVARDYMLHPGVFDVLEDLYAEDVLAAQSMFYYKPPGSKGQALHQDNFYLKVQPGNCVAAWTAIDDVDEENGGLLVVPQTNEDEIVCPELADRSESFTHHYVKPPEGKKAVPVNMKAGDVLFFNGNLIHGSYRNKTKDRYRRAFICHYANGSAEEISKHYNPLYRRDGQTLDLKGNPDGGPCGVEFEDVYPH
ncbi:phytanoyl-CoA dioxygenase family protein [Bacillaceae bacterium SIJ1]|uniref:phytanoyl-CoA dioxygenase family protein n=1 Tax=Litoribacterium kuwaitense TaxID=1398745 RepID=UPI0013EA73F2|nr:phytanoyl-CoA dioxygenase family protein [Litoribacterium kuwaitense]NGP45244.1 phytanoyl-CoA dioxygenase family protein [Litoribacterium kuwaitense]